MKKDFSQYYKNLKLFGKWDWNVEVKDPSLKNYISLKPCIIPKVSYGRHYGKSLNKKDLNIVERLVNKMFGPGHKGKKHLLSSDYCAGQTEKILKIIKKTFEIIEEKTKRNPIEILVRAIENAAPIEEPISFQVGGIIARKPVIVSPLRRINIALRNLVNVCYRRKFNGTEMAKVLAEELIAAANNDISKSFALKERERIEREAEAAR